MRYVTFQSKYLFPVKIGKVEISFNKAVERKKERESESGRLAGSLSGEDYVVYLR